jgi:hypothetical protein
VFRVCALAVGASLALALGGPLSPLPAKAGKSPAQVSREISDAAAGAVAYERAWRLLPLWLLVPGVIRRVILSRLLADPRRRKRLTGTTFVSAVGMFGHGTAWGIPQAQNYTLGLTVGGIAASRVWSRSTLASGLSPWFLR